MITAKPFKQGKVIVISGPVGSEKTEELECFLDSIVDSGFKQEDNILVVRHPRDDKEPEYIGKHRVIVTEKVEEIYNKIRENTGSVVVAGISHYNQEIVALADAIVRSGRNLIASGLNLDNEGKPFGSMPGVMALADEVILAKAYCSERLCWNDQANRSTRKEPFLPICSHHYNFPNSPPIAEGGGGELELYIGSMFSAKSTKWARELDKVKKAGLEYVVFKWIGDSRGKEQISLHSGKTIKAFRVEKATEVSAYLKEHPKIRQVFIDEAQFLDNIYETVFDLLPKGYKISLTGLPRGFNRRGFGEFPALMCLADKINMRYAICMQCGEPATENQRIKIISGERKPAHYNDSLVLVGGKETYEARCLKHWELVGEPPLKYELGKFEF